MDIKELKKQLEGKKAQEERLKSAYLQVVGQRILLEDMIKEEEKKEKKNPSKEKE